MEFRWEGNVKRITRIFRSVYWIGFGEKIGLYVFNSVKGENMFFNVIRSVSMEFGKLCFGGLISKECFQGIFPRKFWSGIRRIRWNKKLL